jgi:hypothetical protein
MIGMRTVHTQKGEGHVEHKCDYCGGGGGCLCDLRRKQKDKKTKNFSARRRNKRMKKVEKVPGYKRLNTLPPKMTEKADARRHIMIAMDRRMNGCGQTHLT